MNNQIEQYGVIGDPIEHSLSPKIHQQFAKQLNEKISYNKYHVTADHLNDFIKNFFYQDGKGLNVTLPHKQKVISLIDEITDDARLANSVNTLSINPQGKIQGDTTDGKGLLLDLNNKKINVKNKKLLIIGAGGASQSIIVSLLKAGASISLYNRTIDKANQVIQRLTHLGEILLYQEGQQVDGIINSISEFNFNFMQPIIQSVNSKVFCYDLNYADRANDFKQFVTQYGCSNFSDGLGMLIGQAAMSYKIWRDELPRVDNIII